MATEYGNLERYVRDVVESEGRYRDERIADLMLYAEATAPRGVFGTNEPTPYSDTRKAKPRDTRDAWLRKTAKGNMRDAQRAYRIAQTMARLATTWKDYQAAYAACEDLCLLAWHCDDVMNGTDTLEDDVYGVLALSAQRRQGKGLFSRDGLLYCMSPRRKAARKRINARHRKEAEAETHKRGRKRGDGNADSLAAARAAKAAKAAKAETALYDAEAAQARRDDEAAKRAKYGELYNSAYN